MIINNNSTSVKSSVNYEEETDFDIMGQLSSIWNSYLKEPTACALSFLPKEYQMTDSYWGKGCATKTRIAWKQFSKVTDYTVNSLKKLFAMTFSFHSFPKLPLGISETPTSNSLGATLLLGTGILTSTARSFFSIFKPIRTNINTQRFLSGIEGSLIGSGTSLLFGQNSLLGAFIGAASMIVTKSISQYTSKLQPYAIYSLTAMGVMNCANIVHQEFLRSKETLENFAMNWMMGNSAAKFQFQLAQKDLSSLSWKPVLYAYSLPYAITAYLSLAFQSNASRAQMSEAFNNYQTLDFLPKAFSFIPDWATNSYTLLNNLYAEAGPFLNHTITSFQSNSTVSEMAMGLEKG
jgi:hypothetical protein